MAISNANATKINKMNEASHKVNLGTLIQQLQTGSATVVSASATLASASATLAAGSATLASASATLASGSAYLATGSATLASACAILTTNVTALQAYRVWSGSTVVTTQQMSASAVTLYNPNATGGGFEYNVYRSGSPLAKFGSYKYTRSGGSLTIGVYDSGSFTVGDVVQGLLWA